VLPLQIAKRAVKLAVTDIATPSSFAASGRWAFGEGSAKGTFVDAAPLF